jgi:hypothetical protein
MKNSNALSLVLCIGIMIVIGCSCPNMDKLQKELEKGSSSPTPSSTPTFGTNTSSSPSSSDKAELTLDKYNQIKKDMSLEDVQEILGSDGAEVSSSEIGKYKTVTQKWDGENYSYIICTFQNDKMMFKSQGSLK